MSRLLAVLALVAFMGSARWLDLEGLTTISDRATVSLGFILIVGYLLGRLVAPLRLPRITGYILAGILCGPYTFGFLTESVVGQLQLVDELALALIAFTAGGELRLKSIRPRLRSIITISLLQIIVIFTGLFGLAYWLVPQTPLFQGPGVPLIGVALLVGLIGVANSPAATVALINEYRAKGPFTDTVLGVTVFKDVLVLILISVVLPLVKVITVPGQHFDLHFLGELVWTIGGSLVGGVVLGLLVTAYMKGIQAVLPLFVVGVSVLVSQVAHSFHLESLLICMAAGFVIENLTSYGDKFIQAIERSYLPVYVVFFAIGGASLDLGALQSVWILALLISLSRVFLTWVAVTGGETLAKGDNHQVKRLGWMSFISQAGVTLAIGSLAARKFPEWGPQVKTLSLALIALHELAGPVALRWALLRSGEGKTEGR